MTTDGDPEGDARVFAGLFPALYLRFHRRRDPRKLRLSSQTWAVLQHLAHSGPLTVGEAASHFDRSQSVVSAMVASLERRLLVERMRDAKDRRRSLIWLTPEGQALLAREREVLDVGLLATAMRTLSPPARRALLAGMRALASREEPAAPPAPTKRKTTKTEKTKER